MPEINKKFMFTKEQVEQIVSRIIHQNSFGDVHWEANKVSKEFGLDFSKNNDCCKNESCPHCEEELRLKDEGLM
ncbi:MAG TPA: hypothetical protein VFV86_00145 [Nitrososphaeraceae archaeon]|nr:hypothetical protein [Nitrososphaeraceae archaeon]